MDHLRLRDRDFDVDLENGGTTYEEVGNTDPVLGAKVAKAFTKICSGFGSVDSSFKGENVISKENMKSLIDKNVEGERTTDPGENKQGMPKTTSGKKKPRRPPRPPKSLSLDAADQKLIKEIAQIAMVKRARIERMKGLKKMKAAKASISTANMLAMIFTVLFCLVIIFQGMGRSSTISFQGSLESALATQYGLISLHYRKNTSASSISVSTSGSSSVVRHVSELASSGNVRRAAESK